MPFRCCLWWAFNKMATASLRCSPNCAFCFLKPGAEVNKDSLLFLFFLCARLLLARWMHPRRITDATMALPDKRDSGYLTDKETDKLIKITDKNAP